MRALYTAATGMAAQELNVQVISNNIANLRTTGYKKQRAAFQDLIYDHVRRVGAQASDQGTILPVGIDIGGGVKTVGTPRSMTQGTLSQTGNDLDLAITGEGFFKIQMPDGTYQYTRDGTFQMDNQGRIVNAQGNLVQPAITVPQNASGLTVNAQGQVSVTLPGSTVSLGRTTSMVEAFVPVRIDPVNDLFCMHDVLRGKDRRPCHAVVKDPDICTPGFYDRAAPPVH